jgi:hypothetical protein
MQPEHRNISWRYGSRRRSEHPRPRSIQARTEVPSVRRLDVVEPVSMRSRTPARRLRFAD